MGARQDHPIYLTFCMNSIRQLGVTATNMVVTFVHGHLYNSNNMKVLIHSSHKPSLCLSCVTRICILCGFLWDSFDKLMQFIVNYKVTRSFMKNTFL